MVQLVAVGALKQQRPKAGSFTALAFDTHIACSILAFTQLRARSPSYNIKDVML